MRRFAVRALLLSVGFVGVTSSVRGAVVPEVLSFQGRLTDTGGTPVNDPALDITFRIYDDATSVSPVNLLWEDALTVPVTDGVFSVLLGDTSTGGAMLDLAFDTQYWLALVISPDADEMDPRFQLAAAPYAIGAKDADTVDGQHAADLAETDTLQTVCTRGSSVTGTASPVLYVEATSTGFQARAIEGRASSATGVDTWAVYGRSDSESGVGVRGLASAATGTTRGVHAQSDSTSGYAVYGDANAASGLAYGVYGISRSTSGCGVCGSANAASGTTYGVYGRTTSASGYDFYAGGAGTDYGSASSIRWKKDIERIDNALGKVGRLRGVYFNWDEEHGGHYDLGMIAEEVGAVLPEIVGYEENGEDALGMDYGKLTPVLVEAVKELKAKNEALEAEFAELKAMVGTLAGAGE